LPSRRCHHVAFGCTQEHKDWEDFNRIYTPMHIKSQMTGTRTDKKTLATHIHSYTGNN